METDVSVRIVVLFIKGLFAESGLSIDEHPINDKNPVMRTAARCFFPVFMEEPSFCNAAFSILYSEYIKKSMYFHTVHDIFLFYLLTERKKGVIIS